MTQMSSKLSSGLVHNGYGGITLGGKDVSLTFVPKGINESLLVEVYVVGEN